MTWFSRFRRSLPRKLPLDRIAFALLLIAAMVLAGRSWLADNPQHNPFAPLDLRAPRGWATKAKLSAIMSDVAACRAVLERSEVTFSVLPPEGEGACLREDRVMLDAAPLTPGGAQLTCPVAAGLALWIEHDLQPLAEAELGARITRIEHLGTYNCRRIGGGEQGRWSEHATGNAIDIAGFVLEDGRRISVLRDWQGEQGEGENSPDLSAEAQFLHGARDAACASFGTVLSPDYNAAHADHLHLDQGRSPMITFCR